MQLDGRVVVVPGAGGGMGTSVARLFGREGARVVLAARRAEPLEELADLVRDDGGKAEVCTVDAATEEGCELMVSAAVRAFGRVDVLYCNMGDYAYGDSALHETPPDAWDYLINLNLRAHYLAARAVVAQLLRQNPSDGVLIHVAASDDVTRDSNPGYTTAKAGLIALVKRIARQYRRHGIRANAICPGSIGHEMPPPGPIGLPPGSIAREAHPLDVAHAALYLASEASGWVTGHVLPVEGGHALG